MTYSQRHRIAHTVRARKTFEDRCNGGKPISWTGGTDWEAADDEASLGPVKPVSLPAVGGPERKHSMIAGTPACRLCRVGGICGGLLIGLVSLPQRLCRVCTVFVVLEATSVERGPEG